MCYLNFYPLMDDEEDHSPPRGCPKLEWAVPVDIVQLGTSLEAYSNTLEQTSTLRLAHRFRASALSRLPQEILEQIIDEVHTTEQASCEAAWISDYRCFQTVCRPQDHYQAYSPHVEDLWHMAYDGYWEDAFGDEDELRSRGDYSEQEKVDMVVELVANNPMIYFETDDSEMCNTKRDNWLGRVCSCSEMINGKETNQSILKLHRILKVHFGLEVIVLHEMLHHALDMFLPLSSFSEHGLCHTAAYLSLPSKEASTHVIGGRSAPLADGKAATDSSHMIFRQNIDPSLLQISEDARRRFARAMRVLHTPPSFHLAELQQNIRKPILDKELLEIDASSTRCCAIHRQGIVTEKTEKLWVYVAKKNEELAKQSWPQLMILAASDTVSPC